MRQTTIALLLLVSLSNLCAGQGKASKPRSDGKAAKIARALSAAPANIATGAKVVDRAPDGKDTTLREGANGFTCFAGQPGVVGATPFCANAAALQWEDDMAAHRPKPTNTEPGIEYMLAGGTDWSGPRRDLGYSDQRAAPLDDHVAVRPSHHKATHYPQADGKLDHVRGHALGPSHDQPTAMIGRP